MLLLQQNAHLLLKIPLAMMHRLPIDVPAYRPTTTCGPKARATLAWGKAPGSRRPTNCGLKARAKPLIPHKPLIERHTIFHKHRPHLRLKIPPLMMHLLPIDIPHQRTPVAQSNRERRVPTRQLNLANSAPLVLTHLDDDTFNLSTTRDIDSVRARNRATCTWSATPPTRTQTFSEPLATDARYACISARMAPSSNGRRSFVLKTRCTSTYESDCAIAPSLDQTSRPSPSRKRRTCSI